MKKLLDEKNKSQQELLLEAVAKSKRSYDEIMLFIQSDPTEDVCYEPGQGFLGVKKQEVNTIVTITEDEARIG